MGFVGVVVFVREGIIMYKYTEQALKELIEKMEPVLVVAHTDWCSSCRRIVPFVQQLEANYKNKVTFVDIDADLVSDKYIQEFGVDELPAINMVVNGIICPPCKTLDTPEDINKYIMENLNG